MPTPNFGVGILHPWVSVWLFLRYNASVTRSYTFRPPRQPGFTILVLATVLLATAGVVSARSALQHGLGTEFLLYMLPGVVALVLTPLLAYRAYALIRATYTLERDRVLLRWGLRSEQIPMNSIHWVRPASELDRSVPVPKLPLPGALLGRRHVSGLGDVEYMASSPRGLVLISTGDRLFALSPGDNPGFLQAYRELSEQGSLSHIPAQSVFPVAFLAQMWSVRSARLLILAGFILNLAILIFTIVVVPTREQIYLGFDPFGAPRDALPAAYLLLLPLLSGLIYLFDTILGMFLFRQADVAPSDFIEYRNTQYALAYVLWGAGALTPLLFLIGSYYLVQVAP